MRSHPKQLRDFDSFIELATYFDSEQKAVDYLATLRWNGQPQCPYCGHDHAYELKGKQRLWKCANCRKKFSVRIGTIFEESKISLRKWFFAVYLTTAHRKGISSHQLARDIGVTQKTAWFLLHRIRRAFQPEKRGQIRKTGEIDLTYVGGKEKNNHWNKRTVGTQGRSTKTKTPILGIFERNGKVFAVPVKDTKKSTVVPIVSREVAVGTKVYTDDNPSYLSLRHPSNHEVVNHSAREFVRSDVHTNSIESFWALLKRNIGIYHRISDKHLGRYVDEFTFRFNSRELTDGSRFDVMLRIAKADWTIKR